jgi:hypothetical protein
MLPSGSVARIRVASVNTRRDNYLVPTVNAPSSLDSADGVRSLRASVYPATLSSILELPQLRFESH